MFTEEQTQELKRCKEDPVYFINNYVKFNHFKDGLSNFKLYEPQEKLINNYHNNRFNIVKASRQIAGKSSTAIYYILHHILFEDSRTVGLFSHNINPSIHLLDLLKVAYENLPEWLQQNITVNNRQTLELENGSKVIASSISPYNLKGLDFSLMLLDEMGSTSYTRLQEFFELAFPIIYSNKNTKVIITSTKDYYEDGYFNKMWNDSEEGKNDFVRTKIKWSDIPGKNEEWKEKMIETLGIDVWNREFDI